MRLTKLSFENYKPFSGRQDIDLLPITVLIGRNSSGKSAISRLPLLLAQALSARRQAPLELEVEGVDFGSSFIDLVHNRLPHGSIGLGATFDADGREVSFWTRIQHFSEFKLQVVMEFQVAETGVGSSSLKRIDTDPQADPAAYSVLTDGKTSEAKLTFRGLIPEIKPETGESPILTDLREGVGKVCYLGPFRRPPERQYRFPGGAPDSVGFSGVNAPAILGADAVRRGRNIVQAVGSWYRSHLGGWALSVSERGDMFSLVLRSPDDEAVEVNLVDAGAGLSQVLPIVVQRLADSTRGAAAGLEIVEQPELHLHPSAHGSVADLYATAVQKNGCTFVIETHSENFILRLRRRIADGTLRRDQVAIYWVDDTTRPGSVVRPIALSEQGDVEHWPKDVFSEDFIEMQELRKAQRAKDQ